MYPCCSPSVSVTHASLSFRLYSPIMMFDRILRLCCWPTSMDSSLRCALALRGCHSCLYPCPRLFPCSLCPCHCANRVCYPWSPSCILSYLHHLSCRSAIHQLRSHDAVFLIHSVFFLHAPLPALYPFQAMAHTSSYDMSLLVSESFCVIFVPFVPTLSRSVGTGPSSAIISFTMISSFSIISSIFSVPPGIPV